MNGLEYKDFYLKKLRFLILKIALRTVHCLEVFRRPLFSYWLLYTAVREAWDGYFK
jgi:hypothetical protein